MKIYNTMCIWNKNFIIVDGGDCNIYIINLNTKQICKAIKRHKSDILIINKIKFNYKEEYLINLDYYCIIKIWNIFNLIYQVLQIMRKY